MLGICSYFAFNHIIKYISGKTHTSIQYLIDMPSCIERTFVVKISSQISQFQKSTCITYIANHI